MKHKANPRFWEYYRELPPQVQALAHDYYELLRQDRKHPSLHLKKAGRFWSARIGLHYRAFAVQHDETIVWFWIGTHAVYNRILSGR